MLATIDDINLDTGPRASKPGTERMCAVTRQVQPIDDLIRFVVAPAGDIVPDLKRKLPGRGLWISASRGALSDAVKRGTFAKGFKRELRPSPTLVADTEALIARGAVEALAMLAKAKLVVSGFTKVENAVKEGKAFALIHASDGAADGIRKLNGLLRAAALPDSEGIEPKTPDIIQIIQALTSAELDLALGRANVIHAALLAGPASKTFLSRCHGLVRFRTIEPGETASPRSVSKTRATAPRQD